MKGMYVIMISKRNSNLLVQSLCIILSVLLFTQSFINVYASETTAPEDSELITSVLPPDENVQVQKIEMNSGKVPYLPDKLNAELTTKIWSAETEPSEDGLDTVWKADTQITDVSVNVLWKLSANAEFSDTEEDTFTYVAEVNDTLYEAEDGINMPVITVSVIGGSGSEESQPIAPEENSPPEQAEKDTEQNVDMAVSSTREWFTVDGVEGGRLQFDTATGEITDADPGVTVANIPQQIGGVDVVKIGNSAFYGCRLLTTVTMPDTVITIGQSAFAYCALLSSVTIGSGVQTIENSAFSSCDSLTSIIIPDHVISLGNNAFQYCDGLLSVTIGSGITRINPSTFAYSEALETVVMSNNVTHIDSYAFSACSSLNSVTMSSALIEIANSAFRDCSSLSSITLPEGLETIGDYAFINSGLTSVTIPSTTTVISSGVFMDSSLVNATFLGSSTNIPTNWFKNCTSLETVTLPDGLQTIYGSAFENCTSLQTIDIPSTVTEVAYNAFLGCTSLTSITIPESVQTIGMNAFSNCGFTTAGPIGGGYDFEYGWTQTIPDYALYGASALVSVDFPNTLEEIGDYAFALCTSLLSVTIPGTVIGSTTSNKIFQGCTSLHTVVISEGTKILSPLMFEGCTALKNITLPSTLNQLFGGVFSGCSVLENVVIPPSVTSMGADVFKNCTLLTTAGPTSGDYDIRFTASETIIPNMFYGANTLTSITLPNTVLTIGGNSFNGTTALKSINLPTGLKTIENNVFAYSGLESIVIPNSVTGENLGGFAFRGCSNLHTVTLPNAITKLDSGIFQDCTALENIEIPNTVTVIGTNAFEDCSSLQSIVIPNSVTGENLRGFAFSGCSNLHTVTLPNAITQLDSNTFKECTALKNIEIPNTVTVIGTRAFENCSSLQSITLPSGLVEISLYAFASSGLVSIDIPDSVTTIGNYAFYTCASLEVVELGNSLEIIGTNAFGRCSKLRAITLPNSLTEIGSYAFQECKSLQEISIPEGVTVINGYTFSGCTQLANVYLPETLEEIQGYYPFRNCNLSELYIPASVNIISTSRAFDYLPDNFTLIVVPGTEGEAFAMKNNIPYLYPSSNTVALELTLPVGDYSGMTLRLTNEKDGSDIKLSTANKNTYKIYGLEKDESYLVELLNAYGAVLGSVSTGVLTETETAIEITELSDTYAMTVLVKAGGIDVSDMVDIRLYENTADGVRHIGSGTELSQLSASQIIAYEIVLNDELKTTYHTPPSGTHTITASENNVVITLAEIENVTINGKVLTEDNKPMANVAVTLSQNIGGQNIISQADTASDGTYKITVKNLAGTLSLSKPNYFNQTIQKNDWLDGRVEDVTLREISGVTISVIVEKKDTMTDASDSKVSSFSTSERLDFSLFNSTQNKEITNATLQYPAIIVTDNSVVSGDKVTITVKDKNGEYADATGTVTVNGEYAETSILMTQNGTARFTADTSLNLSEVAVIYDSDGNYVDTYSYKSLVADTLPLKSGTYTVVSIGENEAFNRISTLDGITDAGLVESTDYVKTTFTVSAGEQAKVNTGDVPQFSDDKFYYTDTEQNFFRANYNSVVVGKIISVRTGITFKPEYANRVSNVKFITNIPNSLDLIEDAVYLGKAPIPFTFENGALTVSVNNLNDMFVFCVDTAQVGNELLLDGWIEFTLDGETKRQPIGSELITVNDFSFYVPKKTSDTNIEISGNAFPKMTFYVYDNDRLIGEVTSNEYGEVSDTVTLNNQYSVQDHIIHMSATLSSGAPYRSQNYSVRYNVDYVEVESVRLTSEDIVGGNIVFNFDNYKEDLVHYSIRGSVADCTFSIKFSDTSKDAVKDVVLYLEGVPKEYEKVVPKYSERTGEWVVYVPDIAPTGFALSYEDDIDESMSIEQSNDENDFVKMVMDGITSEGNTNPYGYTVTERTDNSFKADLFWDDETYGSETLASAEVILLDYQKHFAGTDLEGEGYTASIYDANHYIKIDKPNSNTEVYTVVSPTDGAAFQMIYDYTPIMDAIREDYDAQIEAMSLGTSISESAQMSSVQASSIGRAGPLKWLGWVADSVTLVTEAAPWVDLATELYSMISFIDETTWELNAKREYILMLAQAKCKDGTPRLDNPSLFTNQPIMDDVLDYNFDMQVELAKYAAIWAVDKAYGISDKVEGYKATYDEFMKIISGHYTKWQLTQKVVKFLGSELLNQIEKELPNTSAAIKGPVGDVMTIYEGLTGGMAAAYTPTEASSQRRKMSKTFAEYDAQLRLIELQILQAYKDCSAEEDTPEMLGATAPGVPRVRYPRTLQPIIDPSGYVYEAVPSNRLEGVTTTVYEQVREENIFGEVETHAKFWNAQNFGQENPLTTNEEGRYAWDVPTGNWQVKYEFLGYETTYSEWLPVPPPQLEVNIPMTSYAQPTVVGVAGYQNGIVIEFSKYMEIDTVSNLSVSVTVDGSMVSGQVLPINEELTADGSTSYASKFEFVPSENFTVGQSTQITVTSDVLSYARTPMVAAYVNSDITIALRPESITPATDTVEIVDGSSENLVVTLAPAAAVAGKVLTVTSAVDSIANYPDQSVIIAEDGTATISISGMAPGSTVLTLTLAGTDIESTVNVNVNESVVAMSGSVSGSVESLNSNTAITVELSGAGYSKAYTIGTTVRSFMFTDVPAGEYTLTINQQGNLDTVILGIPLESGQHLSVSGISNLSLITGDINADNIIDYSDISTFVSPEYYNIVANATNSIYDINGDGNINFADVSIIRNSQNYGKALNDTTFLFSDME